MGVIYHPKGPAQEYAHAAINIYKGCTHRCAYCYAPAMLYRPKEIYFRDPDPKKDIVERVRQEADAWARKACPPVNMLHPEILISFIGDPYQPAETELGLTRSIIKILIERNLQFSILTKGGHRAVRDFDLLSKYPHCRFGTSLSFFSHQDAGLFEPGAADVMDRVATMAKAKDMGIETWVSLEPVIIPQQAIQLVKLIPSIVDFWAVGKINHNKRLEAMVDWPKFLIDIEQALREVGASYYIKTSLEKYRAKKELDLHGCAAHN
jgi:DNA repair photolyase